MMRPRRAIPPRPAPNRESPTFHRPARARPGVRRVGAPKSPDFAARTVRKPGVRRCSSGFGVSGPTISACGRSVGLRQPDLTTALRTTHASSILRELHPASRSKTSSLHAFTCLPHCPALGRSGSPPSSPRGRGEYRTSVRQSRPASWRPPTFTTDRRQSDRSRPPRQNP